MYGKEPMVVALVHEAMTLWCVGRPDSALAGSLASIAHAEAWVHPFSYAWAQCAHGAILQMRGEVAKMRETALRVIALSSEQGFPNWLAQGLTYLGWTMVVEGDIETGIEKMREGNRHLAHDRRSADLLLFDVSLGGRAAPRRSI